ncbi:hypothetical protein PZE02_004131 [Salmonella enterica subsp. enterica serovar Vitkin]|uniref:Uncharacterized protein n=1 Tax=Salmonella enterica TaxID=28901 RepID=A0A757YDQ7_SALER|nr:hypothetical protein [Salmonella enterica]EDO3965505.1 hypothetical protein [Salmonella enterica subsp. enterica serovar Enteritidis]EEA0808913.1 hypothetical protein [Salmonella enterica subsp. enterica serovar Minnesota]EEA5789590.1 hypothetical protein [Salmonella enterica subsp. enterica serovar Lattenkamp]EEB1075153.1 hypothetical protein [Salmonella enterica subsp. enterica serovar Montevideo]EEE9456468.1 hypothetical protein [Salmonella enterica subsp. enterica serovar Vitkin]EEI123
MNHVAGPTGYSPEGRKPLLPSTSSGFHPAVDLSDGAPVTTSRGGCPGADAKVFDARGKKFCGRYTSPWTAETGCGYFSPRKVRSGKQAAEVAAGGKKPYAPQGVRGAPSPARQWRRDRSGRCKPGFQTSDRSEARNRASGFGGAWQVRQQLPGGVGLDDRMPSGSREPKVSMRSWPTEQQTPHSKNSSHTMNGRKGCAAGAACLHFRQASACQGFSAA